MKKTSHSIITLPNPLLQRPSTLVNKIDQDVRHIADIMQTATLQWEANRKHEVAVALAAVQVGILKQVLIVRHSFKDRGDQRFEVYINPEITRFEGEPVLEPEGCLSVRDIYVEIARYPKIKVKAKTLDGRTVKLLAKGFLARVLQHEIDHTQGITIVDRGGKNGSYFQLTEDGHMHLLEPKARQHFLQRIQVPQTRSKD